MGNIIIRNGGKEDAEAIASLHADSWRLAYRGMFRDEFLDGDVFKDRKQVWRQRFAEPGSNQVVFVAEEGRQLRGFVCAFGGEDPQWGTFIDNLHVRHDKKRQGIGKQLMQAVARWSQQHYPGAGLYLSVLEPNIPARRFYEALGATNQASRPWEPPGGGEVIDLRYVWPDPTVLLAKI